MAREAGKNLVDLKVFHTHTSANQEVQPTEKMVMKHRMLPAHFTSVFQKKSGLQSKLEMKYEGIFV